VGEVIVEVAGLSEIEGSHHSDGEGPKDLHEASVELSKVPGMVRIVPTVDRSLLYEVVVYCQNVSHGDQKHPKDQGKHAKEEVGVEGGDESEEVEACERDEGHEPGEEEVLASPTALPTQLEVVEEVQIHRNQRKQVHTD